MSEKPSLRSRLVVGSLLWSVGLSAVVILVANALVRHYPRSLAVVHISLLTIAAIGLIAAGLWQVRRGLSPFSALRARLLAVRDGHARRVDGGYPAEVQPLVDDLNALLDDREQRVARAIAKAGDLAHGLKTPLAVLAQEAALARAQGHTELASLLDQQITKMRRQIEYHLAHARAAAAGGASNARCSLKTSADGLARTLARLHADRGLTILVTVPADLDVRVGREDLDEMLGNLLDNACKWARSRVTVAAAVEGARTVVLVEDDGPGLDPAMREAVLQRGVRADEAAPGSGLGLAIVSDLAEIYGGAIALDRAPDGGVRAKLTLPGVDRDRDRS